MRVNARLLLARDRQVAIGFGAFLNLLAVELNRQSMRPLIRQFQPVWWQKDPAARKPISGIHHGPTDDPVVVAEQKVVDTTDRAVRRLDGISMDVRSSPQR